MAISLRERSTLFRDRLWPLLESLMCQKGAEYGADFDVHANYRAVEIEGLMSAETAILARWVERMSRLCSFYTDPGRWPQEKVDEEVLDLIALGCVLWAERQRTEIVPPYPTEKLA